MPPVTGAALRAVRLPRPGWGRRGYDEDDVDALLDAVESTLRGGSGAPGVPELNGRPLTE